MRVGVLGPVGVGPTGALTPIGSPSQRLVLAVLASRPGETVNADLLADALWDGEPPRTAATTLRTYVSRLRAVLGDAVAIRPGGYALELPDDDLDAGHFEALLRRAAEAPRPEAAVAVLTWWPGPKRPMPTCARHGKPTPPAASTPSCPTCVRLTAGPAGPTPRW